MTKHDAAYERAKRLELKREAYELQQGYLADTGCHLSQVECEAIVLKRRPWLAPAEPRKQKR